MAFGGDVTDTGQCAVRALTGTAGVHSEGRKVQCEGQHEGRALRGSRAQKSKPMLGEGQ